MGLQLTRGAAHLEHGAVDIRHAVPRPGNRRIREAVENMKQRYLVSYVAHRPPLSGGAKFDLQTSWILELLRMLRCSCEIFLVQPSATGLGVRETAVTRVSRLGYTVGNRA